MSSIRVIQNVKSRPGLNGQTCEIQSHDAASGKFVVLLLDGSQIKLSSQNLAAASRVIRNVKSRPRLNGQTCEIQSHDAASGKSVVLLLDGSQIKLSSQNLAIVSNCSSQNQTTAVV